MKKKTIIVVIILFLVGAAVTLALMFNKNQEGQSKKQTVKETDFEIPGLSAYYDDVKICDLNGYTMEMNEQNIRDAIVPISPKRQVRMIISKNKNKIQSISYEITDTKEQSLVDSGDIEDWSEEDEQVTFTCSVSAIMDPGKEYLLRIHVVTDHHKNVDYYTRAMVEDKKFVAEQIKFAQKFSDSTFNSSGGVKIETYLEPDLALLNDNLGKVTLNSSYAMVKWNELQPKKIGDTQITPKEFCIKDTGEAGTYVMTYQIKATNAQKVQEIYNVAEAITVWSFAGEQYVLAYDREVNQVWEADSNSVGNNYIDFGIQNTTQMEHVESDNQQYIAYSINGDVYLLDVVKKEVTSVFLLGADSAKKLQDTRTRVIKVDNNGNVDYMIYGYSPLKSHVGKNGIFIMQYMYKDNKSMEDAFIPCTVTAEILEKQLSRLCYIGDGTLYIMLENSIYYANLRTMEWGTLVADLEEGSYAVNDSATVIAYNTSGRRNDNDSITVVNLTNGKKSIINAEEGSKITVCGYTGTNLVYGIGEPSNSTYKFFPIYKLEIVDEELKEVKSYSKKNVYIGNVEITDTIINIERWKKGKRISDDQLLDNTEEKSSIARSSYYEDDKKMKELVLSFTNRLDVSVDLKIKKSGGMTYNRNTEVNSRFQETGDTIYYVYGYGKLQEICEEKNIAIKKAREVCGLIVDKTGQKIWTFEENYNK